MITHTHKRWNQRRNLSAWSEMGKCDPRSQDNGCHSEKKGEEEQTDEEQKEQREARLAEREEEGERD